MGVCDGYLGTEGKAVIRLGKGLCRELNGGRAPYGIGGEQTGRIEARRSPTPNIHDVGRRILHLV